MKKTGIIEIALLIFFLPVINAQGKFYTKTGKISFFSPTSVEDINAVNKAAVCLLDIKTGDLQFAVLQKGFEFKKALMQEHFNSDFVESDKYPKAEFKGTIANNNTINYTVNAIYPVNVKGKLSIHGVTKDFETNGSITVIDGKLAANSVFDVLLADYDISIPGLYRDNISKSIKITVECVLEVLK